MADKNFYTSNICWGFITYNLTGVKSVILGYLERHAIPCAKHETGRGNENSHYVFHKDGMSIYLRAEPLKEEMRNEENKIKYLDMTILSDTTDTKDLEDKLREITKQFKKEAIRFR